MPNIRIKDIPTTASATSSTDFIAIDGATNGTRKLSADSPVFSGNLTAPDLILGTSGPSVRSSLGAKASRQGLIFDGTTAVTATSGSLGTQFTIAFDVTLSSVAIQQPLLFFSGSGFIGVRITSGALFWSSAGADFTSNIPANKTTHVVVVGNGTTATPYINGVAGATIAYTASVGAITQIGFVGNPSSTVGPVRLYNRALTAAEVVALYEAGTPSGADYGGTAAGTALNSSAFVQESGLNFDSFSGASTSGFTAGAASTSGARIIQSRAAFAVKKDNTIRVTFTATQNSGTIGAIFLSLRTAAGSNISAAGAPVVAGSNTYIFTATSAASDATVAFVRGNGGAVVDFTISSFTATPLGLLLAPDAQQPGGGTVWYDTSGNSANITLPASGVQWSVPTSGKIGNALSITNTTASTSTTTGSLVLSGGLGVTGALFTGGSGNFRASTTASSGSINVVSADPAIRLTDTDGTADAKTYEIRSLGTAASEFLQIRTINDAQSVFTTRLALFNGGGLYLGTDPVGAGNPGSGNFTVSGGTIRTVASTNLTLAGGSSGASLVLGQGATGNTALSGGLGNLTISTADNTSRGLTITDAQGKTIQLSPSFGATGLPGIGTGANDALTVRTNAVERMRVSNTGNLLIGGTTDITGSGGLKVFGTTASTSTTTGALQVAGGVGVAGAAFVGGNVTVNGTDKNILLNGASTAFTRVADIRVAGDTEGRLLLRGGGSLIWGNGSGTFDSTLERTSANLLTITGALTTTGAIAIGNTVNTVTATLPNRTITMVIGGTTYYIHAKTTND